MNKATRGAAKAALLGICADEISPCDKMAWRDSFHSGACKIAQVIVADESFCAGLFVRQAATDLTQEERTYA